MANYDITFSSSQGFVTGKVYYGQIMTLYAGTFWDGSSFEASPSFADTDIATTELLSSGIFGFVVPAAVKAIPGQYKVFFRDRAGASPAASDNIIHEERLEVDQNGKVKFLQKGVQRG